eukprot:scaffold1172_cov124-Isochrysis_galbana.AAC.6
MSPGRVITFRRHVLKTANLHNPARKRTTRSASALSLPLHLPDPHPWDTDTIMLTPVLACVHVSKATRSPPPLWEGCWAFHASPAY